MHSLRDFLFSKKARLRDVCSSLLRYVRSAETRRLNSLREEIRGFLCSSNICYEQPFDERFFLGGYHRSSIMCSIEESPQNPESLLDFVTCLTLRNVLRLDLSASRVSGVVCPKSSKCPKQPSKICFVTQVKRLGLKVLWKGKISCSACREDEFQRGESSQKRILFGKWEERCFSHFMLRKTEKLWSNRASERIICQMEKKNCQEEEYDTIEQAAKCIRCGTFFSRRKL
ncbi:hypothetical protein CDAR_503371 [Caerostris darwini]|uniref:Recombination activating protein 1 n=1 Tax=Caerostris darwini TaxID=1538125 RepID=A0AAV4NY14_9ARAC|nr:hypothetical protein CDAR_503371 [Caerostris darwini]